VTTIFAVIEGHIPTIIFTSKSDAERFCLGRPNCRCREITASPEFARSVGLTHERALQIFERISKIDGMVYIHQLAIDRLWVRAAAAGIAEGQCRMPACPGKAAAALNALP
jgi:hypothetical protein